MYTMYDSHYLQTSQYLAVRLRRHLQRRAGVEIPKDCDASVVTASIDRTIFFTNRCT